MRKFEVLYDNEAGGPWSVITKNDKDGYWFVYIGNLSNQNTAMEVAEALTLKYAETGR